MVVRSLPSKMSCSYCYINCLLECQEEFFREAVTFQLTVRGDNTHSLTLALKHTVRNRTAHRRDTRYYCSFATICLRLSLSRLRVGSPSEKAKQDALSLSLSSRYYPSSAACSSPISTPTLSLLPHCTLKSTVHNTDVRRRTLDVWLLVAELPCMCCGWVEKEFKLFLLLNQKGSVFAHAFLHYFPS